MAKVSTPMGKQGSLLMATTTTGFSMVMAFIFYQTKKSMWVSSRMVSDTVLVPAGKTTPLVSTQIFTRENGRTV